jgi:hypothetical protein
MRASYICIAQNDLNERSSQIAMLSDIQKAPDAVYAWLGESDAQDNAEGLQYVAKTVVMREWRMSRPQVRSQVDDVKSRIRYKWTSNYRDRMWIRQKALLAKAVWFFKVYLSHKGRTWPS